MRSAQLAEEEWEELKPKPGTLYAIFALCQDIQYEKTNRTKQNSTPEDDQPLGIVSSIKLGLSMKGRKTLSVSRPQFLLNMSRRMSQNSSQNRKSVQDKWGALSLPQSRVSLSQLDTNSFKGGTSQVVPHDGNRNASGTHTDTEKKQQQQCQSASGSGSTGLKNLLGPPRTPPPRNSAVIMNR